MKHLQKYIEFFLLLGSLIPLWAQKSGTSESYEQLLKKADSQITFESGDFSAEYTITKRDPGGATQTTKAIIFRRDSKGLVLVLIVEPASEKGKGYLKVQDNLWLYDPKGKAFIFTNAQERFQNSSLRNSDLTPLNLSSNYKIVKVEEEILGKFDCYVFHLEAQSSSVTFPKMKVWISKPDHLIRMVENYSLSNQKLRIIAYPSYQKIGNRWTPAQIVIQDLMRSANIKGKIEYEQTIVNITKPSIAPLADEVYTKEYLQRVSQ